MGRPKKDAPNRADGLYEVKVTLGKDFDGKLIRKSFYSSISKADAKAKAEQYKIDQAVYRATGELPEPTVMTFEKWANKWLDTYKKGVVKDHTYNFTYKSNLEKYIIPHFGHLSEIRCKVGDTVKCTDVIGVEGNTGHSTGSHCHYCIRTSLSPGTFLDVTQISGIPNVEGGPYDDGYRPGQQQTQPNKSSVKVTLEFDDHQYSGLLEEM